MGLLKEIKMKNLHHFQGEIIRKFLRIIPPMILVNLLSNSLGAPIFSFSVVNASLCGLKLNQTSVLSDSGAEEKGGTPFTARVRL